MHSHDVSGWCSGWCSRSARHAVLALAVALSAGCYSFTPGRLSEVTPGQPIRVRLTLEEAARLEPVRLTDDRLVEGLVIQLSENELLVDTRVGAQVRQPGGRALVQRINIPLGQVQEVEFRRRDRLKTAAAVAAVGVGVGVGIAAAFGGGRGDRDGEGDPVIELRGRTTRFQLHVPLHAVLGALR